MIDKDKVFMGIGQHINGSMWNRCGECPYYSPDAGGITCRDALLDDLYELIEAQEPRVMTLGDLRDIGPTWELSSAPYLWMDINPSYRWTRGFWVAWMEVYEMIDGLHPTYNADSYGIIWRCWTSRPSDEQRKAVKWE